MANSKTYTVVKDGEELKALKTLAAAKKLADEQGGKVLCEGECVYQSALEDSADTVLPNEQELEVPEEQKVPAKYTLLRKMNVRKAPSLKADRLKVLDAGAIVEVEDIKDDWLRLTDGSFILYENGKSAKKN